MNIAIDIDQTITHAPAFFSAMTHAFAGSTITIVTVRDWSAPREPIHPI